MSEAFQALTTDYRLSLPYVARVICIDGRRESTGEPVATVAGRLGGLPVSAVATVVGDAEVMHRLALGVEVRRRGRGAGSPTAARGSGARCRCRVGSRVRGSARGRVVTSSRVAAAASSCGTTAGCRRAPARSCCASTTRPVGTCRAGSRWTCGTSPRWSPASRRPRVSSPRPPAAYVPVRSRLFRPWLLPGAAYALPRGTTGIRGRLVLGPGTPVRWARVIAVGRRRHRPRDCARRRPRGVRARPHRHGGRGARRRPSVDVELAVSGPDPAPAPDPDDPLADLAGGADRPVGEPARARGPRQPAAAR